MDDPRESSRPGPGSEGTDRMPARVPAPPFWAEAHAALARFKYPSVRLPFHHISAMMTYGCIPPASALQGRSAGAEHGLIPSYLALIRRDET